MESEMVDNSLLEVPHKPGCSINYQDGDGCTALMRAARSGDTKCVSRLLDAGADTSIRDNNGLDAMDHAFTSLFVEKNDGSCFERLIEGLDVAEQEKFINDSADYLFQVKEQKSGRHYWINANIKLSSPEISIERARDIIDGSLRMKSMPILYGFLKPYEEEGLAGEVAPFLQTAQAVPRVSLSAFSLHKNAVATTATATVREVRELPAGAFQKYSALD